jgi:hypothetical protein
VVEAAEEGAPAEAVSEKGVEDVLEPAERVAAGIAACPRAARHLVAVGVVGAPGFGVREDLVGLG